MTIRTARRATAAFHAFTDDLTEGMTITSPRVEKRAVLKTAFKTVPRIDYAASSRKTEGGSGRLPSDLFCGSPPLRPNS
jgi:hypothetical protein